MAEEIHQTNEVSYYFHKTRMGIRTNKFVPIYVPLTTEEMFCEAMIQVNGGSWLVTTLKGDDRFLALRDMFSYDLGIIDSSSTVHIAAAYMSFKKQRDKEWLDERAKLINGAIKNNDWKVKFEQFTLNSSSLHETVPPGTPFSLFPIENEKTNSVHISYGEGISTEKSEEMNYLASQPITAFAIINNNNPWLERYPSPDEYTILCCKPFNGNDCKSDFYMELESGLFAVLVSDEEEGFSDAQSDKISSCAKCRASFEYDDFVIQTNGGTKRKFTCDPIDMSDASKKLMDENLTCLEGLRHHYKNIWKEKQNHDDIFVLRSVDEHDLSPRVKRQITRVHCNHHKILIEENYFKEVSTLRTDFLFQVIKHEDSHSDPVKISVTEGSIWELNLDRAWISTFEYPVVLFIKDVNGAEHMKFLPKFTVNVLEKNTSYVHCSMISGSQDRQDVTYYAITKLKNEENLSSESNEFIQDSKQMSLGELEHLYETYGVSALVQIGKYDTTVPVDRDHLVDEGFLLHKLSNDQVQSLHNGIQLHENQENWEGIIHNIHDHRTRNIPTMIITSQEVDNDLKAWRDKTKNVILEVCQSLGLEEPKYFFHSGLRSETVSDSGNHTRLLNAQSLHIDLPLLKNISVDEKKREFHSCIITMENESGLIVIPKSHTNFFEAKSSNAKYIEIPPWHMFLFNGNLIHGGIRFYSDDSPSYKYRAFVMTQTFEENRLDEESTKLTSNINLGFVLSQREQNRPTAATGVTCYTCRKRGHNSRNCPDKTTNSGGSSRGKDEASDTKMEDIDDKPSVAHYVYCDTGTQCLGYQDVNAVRDLKDGGYWFELSSEDEFEKHKQSRSSWYCTKCTGAKNQAAFASGSTGSTAAGAASTGSSAVGAAATGVTCSTCRKPGHNSRDCPDKARMTRSGKIFSTSK